MRADRQTDRQTDILMTILCSPPRGDVMSEYTVMKMDVTSADSDVILSEQRVAAPETGARDVTNIESSLDHVITAALSRHTTVQPIRMELLLLCLN